MIRKVKYTCKNCGWHTSIREEWGDIRPKRCMNKKCNTSFLANPESLIIDRPKKEKNTQKLEVNDAPKPKKRRSRKNIKQQEKEKNSE